jgi:hypothetical protein
MKKLAALCLILASTSHANEMPAPKMMSIFGGILCDSQADLEVLLSGMSLNQGAYPEDAPESCGMFRPEMPVPMLVIPLEWYETPFADVLTARFVHMGSDWIQYGWIGYNINPPTEPTL